MTARGEDQLFCRYRKSGDPDLLGQVFDLVAPKLLHTALHLARDPAQAEDLLQATFVTAIQKAESFDPVRPLLPWLTGILTRHAAKARERAARLPNLDRLRRDNGEDPVAKAEGAELVETLRTSVQSLPDEYRQVLLLKLLHGLAPAEIAEVLGVPPGTVRMRLHRGLEKLRGLLPLGLVLGVSAGLAPRGLSAVRSAVLNRVPVAAAAAASIGGALMMKKLLVSSALAAGLLAIWFAWPIPPRLTSEPVVNPPATDRMIGDVTGDALRGEPNQLAASDRTVVVPNEQEGSGTGSVLVTYLLDGAPLQFVGLTLTPHDGTDPMLSSMRGVTGSDGTVLFEGVSAGHALIKSDRFARQQLEVIEDSVTKTTMELSTSDANVSIDGRVVDHAGAPIPNAAIWVKWNNDGMIVTHADPWGEFRLQGLHTMNDVAATAPGYAPSSAYPVRGLTSLTISLEEPGTSLTVGVVDPDRRPVSDALVLVDGGVSRHVSASQTLSRWVTRRHWTEMDGTVDIEGLPEEWIRLTVRAAGMAPISRHVLLESGHNDVTLALAGGTDLHGTVRSPDGDPIVGAEIHLEGYARYEMIGTQTGRDGSFRLKGLTTDRIKLAISADGYATHSEELIGQPGLDLVRDIELKPVLPFRLRFFGPDGEPLNGWRATFSGLGGSYAIDPEGRLEAFVGDEKPRTVHVHAYEMLGAWIECTWLGQIRPREEEIVVHIPDEAMPRSSIMGRLAEPGEGSSRYGWASLTRFHFGRAIASSHSDIDASGVFKIGPLVAGKYDLELIPSLEHIDSLPRLRFGPYHLGNRQDLNLGDILPPRHGRVQVHLSRIDDVPLLDAWVYFYDSEDREMTGRYVDENGDSSLPLPPGQYTASVSSHNGSWGRRTFKIREGEVTEVELSLRPAVRRYVSFPVPSPTGWEEVTNVEYVVRDPAGEVYDADDFDPREDDPFWYMPSFAVGRYTLELTTDTDKRYLGSFHIPNLDPSHVPIKISVSPVR